MRLPVTPPSPESLIADYAKDPGRLLQILATWNEFSAPPDTYLPWHKFRFHKAPDGLNHHEWWLLTKINRRQMRRELPIADEHGRPFTVTLTDEVLRGVDEIDRYLSGDAAFDEAGSDRYAISSVTEEAITSSQLEGAATTRAVAKEMIRTRRPPITHDERMIFNNFHALEWVSEHRDTALTPALVKQLHRVIAEGNLPAGEAGQFQQPNDVRVGVFDHEGNEMHRPPPAELLDERVAALCAFANNDIATEVYVPAIVRAIVVHFLLGYEHPFADGNGRTARALFYWTMLRQEYWLTEFLSISRILREAPAQYARSFIESEQDENDLTYFVLYQLKVLSRAIADQREYLKRKSGELQLLEQAHLPPGLNHRQLALLTHAVRHQQATYTVASHGNSHQVVRQTARQDLLDLENRGYLSREQVGRKFFWHPVVAQTTDLLSG